MKGRGHITYIVCLSVSGLDGWNKQGNVQHVDGVEPNFKGGNKENERKAPSDRLTQETTRRLASTPESHV